LRIKSIGLLAIAILLNSGVLTIRIFGSHYSWYESAVFAITITIREHLVGYC
jgi:hypothetical protein